MIIAVGVHAESFEGKDMQKFLRRIQSHDFHLINPLYDRSWKRPAMNDIPTKLIWFCLILRNKEDRLHHARTIYMFSGYICLCP